jgi:hypothetical protein
MTSNSRGSLPVYGSGIVFYLDRSGSIEGIMLWGLPFTEDPKDVTSSLNEEIVERMKDIIRSNGNVAIQDHSEQILRENSGTNIDATLLSYLHLVEESKYLASLAFSGTSSRGVSVLGRPLHRYTPIKPVNLTNLGKIGRKDDFGLIAEDGDLFYPSATTDTTAAYSLDRAEESGRPPSLKRIYPMQGGMALAGTVEYALEKEMEQQLLQMERSRPPKEDSLWLRQGEENRFVNRNQALAESFLRNVQSGRFYDGTDAVKQAPVPEFYINAKEKLFNSWSGTVDEENNDADE